MLVVSAIVCLWLKQLYSLSPCKRCGRHLAAQLESDASDDVGVLRGNLVAKFVQDQVDLCRIVMRKTALVAKPVDALGDAGELTPLVEHDHRAHPRP